MLVDSKLDKGKYVMSCYLSDEIGTLLNISLDRYKMEKRYVSIISGKGSQLYIIQEINPRGTYISPISNMDQLFLLIQTPNGWKFDDVIPDSVEFRTLADALEWWRSDIGYKNINNYF